MRSFERGIYIGLGLMVLAFVPLVTTAFLSLRQVLNEQGHLISKNAIERVLAERLRATESEQAAMVPVWVLSGDERLLRDFDRQAKSFDDIMARLETEEDTPEALALLARAKVLSRRMRDFVPEAEKMRRRGASVPAIHEYFHTRAAPLRVELDDLLERLVQHEQRELEDGKARIYDTVRHIVLMLTLFSMLTLAGIFLVGRVVVRTMKRKRAADHQRDRMLEEVRRVSRARKEAVEIVAHDLKSPLATVMMSLEVISEQITAASRQDLAEAVGIAQRSSIAMNRLIRDLLDHAKIESGHLALERRDACAVTIAKAVLERSLGQAREKSVETTLQTSAPTIPLRCDPTRVEQVLSNLISNALKFTPAGGAVTVSVAHRPGWVEFSVVDTGPGIAKHLLPHIFDRFWQLRETAGQGNGLGLAIAKSIADSHGGRLGVESEPGRGARFTLELPLGESPRELAY